MPQNTRLLSVAHDYADRFGWAVIPVKGKEAACSWRRYQTAAPTRKQRGGLFGIKGVTGLAVIPGAVSGGLRVRDFDRADAYDRWAEEHPDLAGTLPTVRTRRGFHVYFRADLAEQVTHYEDGELRAGRCIVVAPPSVHPDGGMYEWAIPPGESIPFIPDVEGAGLVGPAPTAPPEPTTVPDTVAEAVAKTLPTGPGQRVKSLWKFARRLKGIPGLDVSPEALGRYVREWHRQALPHIRTKAFEQTELAFYDAWTNSRLPLTDDQFRGVVRAALAAPAPAWLDGVFFPAKAKDLLKVCAALQAKAGADPFFLSARLAGAVVGTDPTYANQLLQRLVAARLLERVEKGKLEGRQATTWRYVGRAA